MRRLKYIRKSIVFLLAFSSLTSCDGTREKTYPSKNSPSAHDSLHVATLYTHQFSNGYSAVYPAENALYYYEVEQRTDEEDSALFHFKFYFRNTYEDFKNYVFTIDGKRVSCTDDGTFEVDFRGDAEVKIFQELTVEVRQKQGPGAVYSMKLSFDPKSIHEKAGHKGSKSGLFIHETDITYMEILTERFIQYHPTALEKAAARKEFGSCVKNAKSTREKTLRLAEALLRVYENNRGIPSDSMSALPPLEQYFLVKKGKGKVWCGTISYLFAYVCSCFDIPARIIGLGNTYREDTDPRIFHADHHTITEIYDEDSRTWNLMDLTFYMLEAKTTNGRKLNFIDFWYLMKIPQERKNLMLSLYDPKMQKTSEVLIPDASIYDRLRVYYKQNQKFCFPYKKGEGIVEYYSF
ncbi:MAG: transglutaminase domain-containing protein [Flavobacteriales bacterium]